VTTHDPSPPVSGGSKLRRALVLVPLVLVVTLLLAEGVLRLLGVSAPTPGGYPRGMYVADEVTGYALARDFAGDMLRGEETIPLRTNADGFRDAPFEPKQSGELRVLALGDSFGFGHFVLAEESYPELVEQALSTDDRPVEVLNLGVPGYCTRQQLAQLAALGPELEPDLVVLGLYLGNDVSENLESSLRRTTARSGFMVRAELDESDLAVTVRAGLNTHSRIWRAIRSGQRAQELPEGEALRDAACELVQWSPGVALEVLRTEETERVAQAVAITRELLADLARHCREVLQVPFALVLIPSPHQYHPVIWDAVAGPCGFAADDYDLDRPQRALLALGTELGFPVLDLTPALRAHCAADPAASVFFDVHFNQAGHALAAREVATFLTAEGLVR
jgi:lysophospholipase L1-like esterase